MTTDYAPPPRGWLYGFLLTITAFWFSGVTWEAFRNHEIGALRLTGAVILLISGVLIAYEALTTNDYRTAKATLSKAGRRKTPRFSFALKFQTHRIAPPGFEPGLS